MRTFSAREFNRDVSAAKRAADDGPVIVTDRGQAAYVLMTIGDYRDLTRSEVDLATLLAHPEGIEIDLPSRELSSRDITL